MASYFALFLLIGKDVFEFQLLPKPGPLVSAVGLLLILASARLVYLTLRENKFAAPVVKHQADRQHAVVDTGMYSRVRHPMYAGIILFLIGTCLWLGSYAAVAFVTVPAGFLILRIYIEERFLRRKLPGYDEYCQRVRYRLIPGVW